MRSGCAAHGLGIAEDVAVEGLHYLQYEFTAMYSLPHNHGPCRGCGCEMVPRLISVVLTPSANNIRHARAKPTHNHMVHARDGPRATATS